MKKRIALLLALSISTVFCSCGNQQADMSAEEPVVIADNTFAPVENAKRLQGENTEESVSEEEEEQKKEEQSEKKKAEEAKKTESIQFMAEYVANEEDAKEEEKKLGEQEGDESKKKSDSLGEEESTELIKPPSSWSYDDGTMGNVQQNTMLNDYNEEQDPLYTPPSIVDGVEVPNAPQYINIPFTLDVSYPETVVVFSWTNAGEGPGFVQILAPGNIVYQPDTSYGLTSGMIPFYMDNNSIGSYLFTMTTDSVLYGAQISYMPRESFNQLYGYGY